MLRTIAFFIMLAALLAAAPLAANQKLTADQRTNLIRDLTAEFGTAKLVIPRSKKPLDITPDGRFDRDLWADRMHEFGPAARLGDLTQITKVEFKGDRIVLELNYGISGGRKWWHRVQIGGSTGMSNLGQATHAPGGTKIALRFEEGITATTAEEVKQLLKPILDFQQRSATELYVEKLPEKFRDAVEKKKVVTGMDRDMVLVAKGRPDRRVRDFKEGVETEDWIYGEPPGNIIFVTFENGQVIRVKESYANVGGQVRNVELEEAQKIVN